MQPGMHAAREREDEGIPLISIVGQPKLCPVSSDSTVCLNTIAYRLLCQHTM